MQFNNYKPFVPYLAALVLVSAICGLAFTEAQQVLRVSANDPQIQNAEDSAVAIRAGKQAQFPKDKIDITQSLAAYLILVDKDGNATGSSAVLDGVMPQPPKGIFDTAKKFGEYRVTWQPRVGVRQALVVVAANDAAGQFIVSGRSLREVEKRENNALGIASVAWAVIMVVSFGLIYLFKKGESV